MHTILTRLRVLFAPERIAKYVVDKLLPDVIVAVFTFLAFYVAWRVVQRGIAVISGKHLDRTAQSFIEQVSKYAILTIGAITALGQLGVNTSSMLASLGVAGLTLGFAARDTLSNLISGVFIFWDRPFVVGDLIELDDKYGRVEEITMRSTRVVTVDGRMLAIPNSQIVNSTVASYTNFPNLRLDVEFTVAVTENLSRIREILLEMVDGDDRYCGEPGPSVVVKALNDYNVAMVLRVWLVDEKAHIPERFALRERTFERLRSAGVEMPFETFAVEPIKMLPVAESA